MSGFVQSALGGSYTPSLDPTTAINRSHYPLNDRGLTQKPAGPPPSGAPGLSFFEANAQQQRAVWARKLRNMTAFQRHQEFMAMYKRSESAPPDPYAQLVTDQDLVTQSHRFIRRPEDDAKLDQWEAKLAKAYYDRLFKEYALVDLARHKEGKLGLRWRVQHEVFTGKGQFTCAALTCLEKTLKTFEVNFAYQEDGQRKNALVKLRLCEKCHYKMNYKKNKDKLKELKKQAKKEEKRKAKEAKKEEKRKAKRAKRDREGEADLNDLPPSKRSKTDERPAEVPDQVEFDVTADVVDSFLDGLFP